VLERVAEEQLELADVVSVDLGELATVLGPELGPFEPSGEERPRPAAERTGNGRSDPAGPFRSIAE
jgi:hypothetical protein